MYIMSNINSLWNDLEKIIKFSKSDIETNTHQINMAIDYWSIQ